MAKTEKVVLMSSEISEDAFCTSREAARLLNISVKSAQLWVENGVLHAWKTPGGHRRITRRSVQELLQERHRVLKQPPSGERAAGSELLQLMIVEDDKRVRRLYELTMSHWGLPLQITMARDGFEALLRIGQRPPDVLIADLNMPGMDGFRLIAALRGSDLYTGLQIVVVSGLTPAQIRAGGGLPKDVPVLAKPIPFNSLRDIIEKRLVNRID
jgi:excisionase family DNA binding protein